MDNLWTWCAAKAVAAGHSGTTGGCGYPSFALKVVCPYPRGTRGGDPALCRAIEHMFDYRAISRVKPGFATAEIRLAREAPVESPTAPRIFPLVPRRLGETLIVARLGC